jgi:hypothetical protein
MCSLRRVPVGNPKREPKKLTQDQMARKVETLQDKVVSFLGKDIIQEESVVTVHMPEMIWEYMQRFKRAQQALYGPKLPLNIKN